VLNKADEAEDFQSVGMHCRESLISFMRKAASWVAIAPEVARPKAADVKGWAEVLGNVVAPGASNKEYRSYLKASARETWDVVNWVTHFADATEYEAKLAYRATEHALTNWSLATIYFGVIGDPLRCPICQSYQLRVEYESGEGFGAREVTICEKCAWRAAAIPPQTVDEPELPPTPPEGECLTVDVPLYPPHRRQ
jgi:hypothetical protein